MGSLRPGARWGRQGGGYSCSLGEEEDKNLPSVSSHVTHTPYLKMLRGGKCVPAPTRTLETAFASISISWPNNPISASRVMLSLSYVDVHTHIHTHTQHKCTSWKRGFEQLHHQFRAESRRGGSAGHSPYVPHIPKIKPRRKINHIPNQTKEDRRYWDGTGRKKSTCSKVCEHVCVCFCVFVCEREAFFHAQHPAPLKLSYSDPLVFAPLPAGLIWGMPINTNTHAHTYQQEEAHAHWSNSH